MVASRKLVEKSQIYYCFKFKDKDHLKLQSTYALIIRYIAARVALKELRETELLDFHKL